MRSYAHMCRDGHVEIGHNDNSSEICPMCRLISAKDRLALERDTLLDTVYRQRCELNDTAITAAAEQGK
jgi:hypothetical protein